MGAETAFLKQWQRAKAELGVKPDEQRPVMRFEHAMPREQVLQQIENMKDLFQMMDTAFFYVQELFQTGEEPIENYAREMELMKGSIVDHCVKHGYAQALLNGALALVDVSLTIVSQIAINRRRRDRPEVRFHHLSNEERESVYFLSSWQQNVADFFIAFGEQDLTPQEAQLVHDTYVRQWADYTADARDVVQKIDPTISDAEFRVANDFSGYKRGIWGTIGVALDFLGRGYEVTWTDPATDVIRKIDLLAKRPEESRVLAVSCKAWSNVDRHLAISELEDIAKAPLTRQEDLSKELSSLRKGALAYSNERQVMTTPVVAVVSPQRQHMHTGRLR